MYNGNPVIHFHRISINFSRSIEFRNENGHELVRIDISSNMIQQDFLIEEATRLAIMNDTTIDVVEVAESVCVDCGENATTQETIILEVTNEMDDCVEDKLYRPEPVSAAIVEIVTSESFEDIERIKSVFEKAAKNGGN